MVIPAKTQYTTFSRKLSYPGSTITMNDNNITSNTSGVTGRRSVSYALCGCHKIGTWIDILEHSQKKYSGQQLMMINKHREDRRPNIVSISGEQLQNIVSTYWIQLNFRQHLIQRYQTYITMSFLGIDETM